MDRKKLIMAATATFCATALYLLKKREKDKRRPRLVKTRFINRDRKIHGFFVYLKKMKHLDEQQFFKYTRMNVHLFNELLNKVSPLIAKRDIADKISPEERLCITLHYLSQGSSLQTIAWKYQIGHSTVHYIVNETSRAIYDVLEEEYLNCPKSEEEWLSIAKGFEQQWNFPHCIGALDGKHISIQAPAKTGTLFYNYKGFYSTVLLALCDSDYIFQMVDIGAYGSQSDGGIFKNFKFGEQLESVCIPQARIIPDTGILMPYVIVADEAFPLKNYIMRPYPGRGLSDTQRIFNYRLSRVRRYIENAFGILAARWRILKTVINAKCENVDAFVQATVCLHNYIKRNEPHSTSSYCPEGYVDSDDRPGAWREEINPMKSVGRLAANRASKDCYVIRNTLRDYFMSREGAVVWQQNVLTQGLV